MRSLVIGVAGGTGAGKITLVRALVTELGADQVLVIQHDSYYADQSHLAPAERSKLNYDHPDALETELLGNHLRALVDGLSVEIPEYDFATHERLPGRRRRTPRSVILIDGILCLADAILGELMDLRVFVEAPDDIRLIRRLRRDLEERGRTPASVIDQYLESVRRMHLEFVEGRGVAAYLRGRCNRSPRKSRDETGIDNAALSAPPGRLVLHPTPAKPRKLRRKPALVSSLARLAGLLGGGGSPERTGLVPSMRLLPLVGSPENSREFVRRGWTK